MTNTLLQAVARKAEGLTADAELLARFVETRDPRAFEEVVRRYGPLVWSVCHRALPNRADAEDAFQAVFLALVRSAPTIRDGRALPSWLHGAAVRACLKAKRDFARRAARERARARPTKPRPHRRGEKLPHSPSAPAPRARHRPKRPHPPPPLARCRAPRAVPAVSAAPCTAAR